MKCYIAIFSLLVLALCGCVKTDMNNTPQLGPKEKYLISINDTIAFSLSSNPTTGYSWKWLNQNDVSIVISGGNQYIQDSPNDKQISGRGGKEIWKFVGSKSGADTIKLGYQRPWESSQPIKLVTIPVRVR
jgi:predicted secreted protein